MSKKFRQHYKGRVYTRFVWQWVDGVLREVPEQARYYDYEGVLALCSAMFTASSPAFRFYNDDGSESTSTAAANQDANLTVNFETSSVTKYHLRWRIQETGGAAGATSDDFQCQVRYNGDHLSVATWLQITTTQVRSPAFNSTNLTDAGSITAARLTGGTGTFSNGEISETGTVVDIGTAIPASGHTEVLFTIDINPALMGDEDHLDYRILYSGSPINTVTPRLIARRTNTGFGALKGTMMFDDVDTPDTVTLTGSISTSADDLIVVIVNEQNEISTSQITDNRGNTYAAGPSADVGAGTTALYYAVVTSGTAGTLTQADVNTVVSSNNIAVGLMVFEGPFASSPLDAAPTPLSDTTSPLTGPASGTLTQADELVLSWIYAQANMALGTVLWTPGPSPFTMKKVVPADGGICHLLISTQVTSATDSITPTWTGSGVTTGIVGTVSFMKQVAGVKQGEARFAGAGALSSLATQNQSFAATFNGSGSLSVLVNQSLQSSATFAGAGSLSAETIKYKLGEATFVGAGSLSALAQTYKFAEATFAGSAQLSIYANMVMRIAATFDGHGNLSAAALQRMAASAFLNGAGDLSVQATHVSAGGEVHQGEATFAGAGNLAVFANLNAVISARFDGAGNLSVETQKSKAAEATFAGAGDLSIYARLNALVAATFNGAGLLSVNGDLAGRQEGAATFDGAGSLQVAARMAAAAAAVLGGAGDWSVQVTAGYAASVRFTGTGNLIVSAAAGNVAAAVLAGAGDLSAEAAMQMPVSAVFAGAGSLSADTAIIAFGTHMGEATFGGRGGMVVDLLQFGPRRTRSSKSEQSLGTRGGVNIVRSRNDRRITRRTGT